MAFVALLSAALIGVSVPATPTTYHHPARSHSVSVYRKVGEQMLRFTTPTPKNVTMKRLEVYVNGSEMNAIWENNSSVYWAGHSTFVQVHSLTRGLAWTAVRTKSRSATLHITYSW